MEERINKSKDMTEIDVPNTVQVIYDYKNNIVVFRYTHSETRIRSPCYVREIDSEYDPKQLEYDIQSEWQKPNEFSSTTRKWKFTEREVPSYMTSSSRVQDMCSGTQIYWMEVTADTHIEKRQITGTSRELILIIPITIFGNPCNIFVYLETISGIPVGISFSQPECTLMTTTTSSMLTSTLSSLTTSSASITSSSTTSTSMTVTSLTTASDPTTSTSLMTTSTPTASTTTDTTASVTSTASITPTPTPTSSVEMTSTSTAQNSTPTTSTPFTTTMTPSTATSTATTTISPTTSTPTATSTEPPC
ncbi:uncharacterized protein LOC127854451 [Dreissena polymorpha]|uniref:uncharacterized protein LOC127854451 n=1 Tax=Dreissena polymorpha TaxID=45954 RepID=UPI002263F96A|nr:uncharacterized protein LOC127854451 [Dreissena polymorpha]